MNTEKMDVFGKDKSNEVKFRGYNFIVFENRWAQKPLEVGNGYRIYKDAIGGHTPFMVLEEEGDGFSESGMLVLKKIIEKCLDESCEGCVYDGTINDAVIVGNHGYRVISDIGGISTKEFRMWFSPSMEGTLAYLDRIRHAYIESSGSIKHEVSKDFELCAPSNLFQTKKA